MIQVFTQEGWWHADFINDQQTLDLFGTTVLPTPFTDSVSAGDVVEVIRDLNPGKIVELRTV